MKDTGIPSDVVNEEENQCKEIKMNKFKKNIRLTWVNLKWK